MSRWMVAVLGVFLGAGAARAQETAPVVPLTLREAVALAADSATAVSLAALRVGEAETQIAQARAGLFPSVSASAGWTDRTLNREAFGIQFPSIPGQPTPPTRVGPFDVYDARLQVAQPLFDPASWTRVRAARLQASATRADREAAAEDARKRAALAYTRATRARATVAAREADLRIAQQLLELAQAQLAGGIGTGIDVIRARTQVATARGQIVVAANAQAQAQVEIARALNLDPTTRFVLVDSLFGASVQSTAPTELAPAVRAALENRAELDAAGARVEAARVSERAIRRERLPRLALTADYGVNGLDPASAISTGGVGVQLSAPLFNGGARSARIQQQEQIAREAQVRSADLREQVAADVQSALLALRSGQEQQAIAREQLALAQAELEQARERFANGIAGNYEAIQAQSSLVRARDATIDAEFNTAVARVNLASAVGVTETIH